MKMMCISRKKNNKLKTLCRWTTSRTSEPIHIHCVQKKVSPLQILQQCV